MAVKLRRSRLQTMLIPLIIGALGLALILFGVFRPLPSYLVAAKDLIPGEPLAESDLTLVELDLGPLAQNYLSELPPGFAAGDFVAAGELLPKRLLVEYQLSNQTLIRIVPSSQPAAAVIPGSLVSIWQVIEVQDVLSAEQLVPRAEVVAIVETDGLFASDMPLIELRLSRQQAQSLITAMAGDIPLFVLPTS